MTESHATSRAARRPDGAATLERTRWGAVLAVSLAVVLAAIDLTAVAVVLPVLGDDLGAGPSVTQWVLLAYNIPMVALSVPAGRWLDRVGHLPAFLLAVAGFGVTSLLIAVAPTAALVLAGRALQGVFSSLLSAVTMPIIAANVRAEHRARAMSVVLTLIPLSGVAGPALGGVLTDLFGWRSVFLINLPIVVVAAVVGRRAIAPSTRGLPWPGKRLLLETAVLGVGATALFAGLYWLPVAVVALIVWLRLPEVRPVRAMLARPALALPLVALPLVVTGVGALTFVLPYRLADLPASVVGLVVLSLSAAMAVFSPIAGVIADRFGYRAVAFTGTVVALIGTVLMLGAGDGPWDLAWRFAVIGIGHGLFAGPNAAAILASTPPELMGTSGGVTTLLRTLGFSVGPALGAAIGGFHPTVAALVVVTALAVFTVAAQMRCSYRAS